jgi:hypothetical protein
LLATFRRPGSAHSEERRDQPHIPLMKGGIIMAKKTVKKATKKAAKKR